MSDVVFVIELLLLMNKEDLIEKITDYVIKFMDPKSLKIILDKITQKIPNEMYLVSCLLFRIYFEFMIYNYKCV
jgi:hypothetical protein